jgi:hypothetical protein
LCGDQFAAKERRKKMMEGKQSREHQKAEEIE